MFPRVLACTITATLNASLLISDALNSTISTRSWIIVIITSLFYPFRFPLLLLFYMFDCQKIIVIKVKINLLKFTYQLCYNPPFQQVNLPVAIKCSYYITNIKMNTAKSFSILNHKSINFSSTHLILYTSNTVSVPKS